MANIVVVDDEELIRALLVDILEAHGHQVRTAVDGRKALALISQAIPDLLITDLVMPESEGLELITEIRRQVPHLRILAISGGGRFLAADQQLKAARLLGADRCLMKPIDRIELMAAVDELLEVA